MAKKKQSVPEYGTVTRKGTLYYRTRITDADGKQVSLYATTCEELYEKQLEARRQVEEIIFHRKHPTVAEYCEQDVSPQYTYSGGVLREMAADAVSKSVYGYYKRIQTEYEELCH